MKDKIVIWGPGMPALGQSLIEELKGKLRKYLQNTGGFGEPEYLDSGGSAALFQVASANGMRAVKVFNPDLFKGDGEAAQRRRLDVQRRLIGHSCPSLVQTYRVEESEGTAFIEMEFISWKSLKAELAGLPDVAIPNLFAQLISAVRFLDENNIVHRDIKPENIHVSPDFTLLKLLDLGVARELKSSDGHEAAITDQGDARPFLATAQYSSPEYLFRLDEPSIKLWKGLTFYQLGAVLHDLIMKEPLFQYEMSLGNRWLVARAVLTKVPDFVDSNPTRLSDLKALAARCLTKDLDARLQLVGWEDFILEGAKDPLTALRARLTKGKINAGGQSRAAASSRLEFDRSEFQRRFIERVRTELLPSCGTSLPLTVKTSSPGQQPYDKFILTVDKQAFIECVVHLQWGKELYERTTDVTLQARILCTGYDDPTQQPRSKLVAVATTAGNEMEPATSVASAIAQIATLALDLIEPASDLSALHGIDLQSEEQSGESN